MCGNETRECRRPVAGQKSSLPWALLNGCSIDRNRDHCALVVIAHLDPVPVTCSVDLTLAYKLRGIIQRPCPGVFQAPQRYTNVIHEDGLIASNIEVVAPHAS